jgi:hypothetical protein
VYHDPKIVKLTTRYFMNELDRGPMLENQLPGRRRMISYIVPKTCPQTKAMRLKKEMIVEKRDMKTLII